MTFCHPPLQSAWPLSGPPALEFGLGEFCAEGVAGVAAALGFLVGERPDGEDDGRRGGMTFAAPRAWLAERGRFFASGLSVNGFSPEAIMVAATRNEADALWALEEALRSGVVSLAIGAVDHASLLATRRLDLAARTHGARVALIKTRLSRNLSAARQRWRVTPHPSRPHPWDLKAGGASRWRVSLERSRAGSTGAWILEQDLETHRLGVVERLADHGLELGAAATGPFRRSA